MLLSKSILTTLVTCLQLTQAVFSVFDDIYSNPKYEVKFLNSEFYTVKEASSLLQNQPSNTNTGNNTSYELLQLPDSTYLCAILHDSSSSLASPSKLTDHNTEEQILIGQLPELSRLIKSSLANFSVLYMADYWTYALWNNTEVTQFHGTLADLANPNLQKYVLGRNPDPHKNDIEGDADENKDIELKVAKEQGIWHISQTFNGGTTCDLTSLPRSVEVQYFCDPKRSQSHLNLVRELRTCQYQFQVSIPELCQVEVLRRRVDPDVNEITCQLVVDLDEKVISKEDFILDGYFGRAGVSEKVSLSDYDLNNLSRDLFSGVPKISGDGSEEQLNVVFDISGDQDSLVERFASLYFTALETNKLLPPYLSLKLLENTLSYTYATYVYDQFGNYQTTLEVNFERLDPPVIMVGNKEKKVKLESNVRDVKVVGGDQAYIVVKQGNTK